MRTLPLAQDIALQARGTVFTGRVRLGPTLIGAGTVDEHWPFTYLVVQGCRRRLVFDDYESTSGAMTRAPLDASSDGAWS